MLYSYISEVFLPPDIILMIIESMEYEPRLFGKLMCISKDFLKLIKANESSLSTHFALPFLPGSQYLPTCHDLSNTQLISRCPPLMSSGSTFTPMSLAPCTLPWLGEIYQRSIIATELVTKRFDHILAIIDEFFPTLERDGHCRNCITRRVIAFQRLSIHLLFRIFDARHDNPDSGRLTQELVIGSMTAVELATVNFLLTTTSIYYSCNTIGDKERSVEEQREIQSVFRQMVLRHGPQIIWASLFASDNEKRSIGKRIETGLVEMRAFETSLGVNQSEFIGARSLQSVLMREFCNKMTCTLEHGWIVIFEVVKDEVLFPDLDKPNMH